MMSKYSTKNDKTLKSTPLAFNKKIITGCLLLSFCGALQASVAYNSGTLGFSTNDQSMWASGDAFVESDAIFLGEEWTNKTATFGGIIGQEYEQITPYFPAIYSPAIPAVYTPYIPATYTPYIPAVTETVYEPRILGLGCGCNRTVTITPAFPSVQLTAAIPSTLLTPAIPPLLVTPAIPATYGDTRTGAQLDVNSSGKVGLEFGYTVNSGSVDATLDFSAAAFLPDTPVDAGSMIDLSTSSLLDGGSITTQSPQLEAYISAIMNLSGSVDAKACLLLAGCADGGFDIPTISMDQRILSIDANSIKILDGILPGDEPLAQIPLANQSMTLEGGATISKPPVPGFALTNSYGGVIATNFPPAVPKITADLAEISVQVPDIATSGNLDSNGDIKSNGRDDVLSLQLDLDGLASVAAGLPPAGLNFDVISAPGMVVEASLDIIDVDAGPVLGVTQDFELIPTLMATLEFSQSIFIEGMTGLQNSWTGIWDDLPNFSITDTTIFTPTYWVDVMLKNNFGLDLGLIGTLDVLKLEAAAVIGGIEVLQFGPLSLNGLLGLGNELFATDKLDISISNDEFILGGFNRVQGRQFTINTFSNNLNPQNPNNPTLIPEPSLIWLLVLGFIALLVNRKAVPTLFQKIT